MNYYQVTIPLKDGMDSEILIAILSEIGFESFEESTDKLVSYIPENDFREDGLKGISYLENFDTEKDILIELIPDRNWNEVWESNYPSVIIGNSCHIRAPFHERNNDVQYDIIIKPKMAFGTAHHETTSMMIELMLEKDYSGLRVLDMGCGSGVLAIFASVLGAREVVAIDIDQWSFENTIENSEVNGVSNITVKQGGAELLDEESVFDVIFANINKNILLRDIKFYSNTLQTGSFIYFSGFYENDLGDIENEAQKYGLEPVEKLQKNGWIAAIFQKL